jgi:uncharacterized membrane protein
MKKPSRSRSNSQDVPFAPKALAIGAGALIVYGLSRRDKSGAALATAGGALAFTAAKTRSSSRHEKTAQATFLVSTTPEKAYALWHDFQNLPRFMSHVRSVRVLDSKRSEWIASGPMDKEIKWTAEIMEDSPNQRIAWRSLPDSLIQTSGFVSFRPDPQNRGTFVTAEVQYTAPGGALGDAVAALTGKHPEFMVREDLRRFKALLEAGEAPTTAGQTHGPRGVHGHTEQVLFRETSNHPKPQAASALGRSA